MSEIKDTLEQLVNQLKVEKMPEESPSDTIISKDSDSAAATAADAVATAVLGTQENASAEVVETKEESNPEEVKTEDDKEESPEATNAEFDEKYLASDDDASSVGIDKEKLNRIITSRLRRFKDDRFNEKVAAATAEKDSVIVELQEKLTSMEIDKMIVGAGLNEEESKKYLEMLDDTGLTGEARIKFAEKHPPVKTAPSIASGIQRQTASPATAPAISIEAIYGKPLGKNETRADVLDAIANQIVLGKNVS